MTGTGRTGSGGNAVSSPSAGIGAAFAAAAVAVSILHWFPFLSLLFAAPLFFLRFRFGNRFFLVSLPAVILLDSLVTVATLGATGSLNVEAWAFSAFGTALLAFPLVVMALPFIRRDEYRLAVSALISACTWVLLATVTPIGTEIDNFLKAFSSETAVFFAEALKEIPESSLIIERLNADTLYGLARKTVAWSVFPAPFIAYAAAWRTGRLFASLFGHGRVRPFSLERYQTGFPFFIVLVSGMLGVIADRFISNSWLETISWNAVIGAGFPLMLQGYGIFRFTVRRLTQRGKRPFLWVGPLVVLIVLTNAWLFLFCALMILGVVELFVPLRLRYVDKGAVDPTPGRGGDHNNE